MGVEDELSIARMSDRTLAISREDVDAPWVVLANDKKPPARDPQRREALMILFDPGVFPMFDSIRSDPRLLSILDKIGLKVV